jgi:hypothetical protein
MSTSTPTRIAAGVTAAYLRELSRDAAQPAEPRTGRATMPSRRAPASALGRRRDDERRRHAVARARRVLHASAR